MSYWGLTCTIAGIIAMLSPKRSGRHPWFGTIYYWCLLNSNFDDGFWPFMVETYAGTIALMLGLGIYDLLSRKRLHATYVIACVWCLANQLTSTWLYNQAWWSEYTTYLVGH